jgi:hypothetical protein
MALAMVSGLVLGQALRSHSNGGVATQPVPAAKQVVTEPAINSPSSSTLTAAPAPPPANDTSTAAQSPAETSDETPAVAPKAPKPAHHAEPKAAPKTLVGTAAASSNIPGTKAALKTPQSHPSATHDSLDELIRKSAAGN